MAHIAFFILPAAGHVNPTLGVAEELAARGHRVTYALPEDMADRAVRVGARAVTYPLDRERFRADMVPKEESDEYTDEGEFLKVLEWLLDTTADTLPLLESAFAEDRPDVVANDPSTFWTGLLLAGKWDIPVIRSTPSYASNEHWALHPPFEPGAAQVDPALIELTARAEKLLKEHGTTSDPVAFAATVQSGPGLFYMPRYFQYAGETFDDRHHFVGPCAPRASFHGTWQRPEDGRPLVMVSLGTIYNERPGIFRACVEAFRDRPWNILLVLGGGLGAGDLGPLPENVLVRDFVPLGDVLPHTDLLVNHGGTSTAMEALAHGVPIVAMPEMPEPRATARRIAELDLGDWLLPGEVTAEKLSGIAQRVLTDDRIRKGLDRMRGEIRRAGGPAVAADVIEGLLSPAA
ncbi:MULTISPECIES: glycosyltransferase [Streptomyces]|nr:MULTISPECIES: glycosyltransferase [Streptomyces]PQM19469.1 glycosyltransferase [Streptomyces xinghaiensis]RKM89891.1 glycosyltransferase [Streptomyces xinghaiensis]RNC68212.1 glycosyltransferase [Streptomyces xinghaiensis]